MQRGPKSQGTKQAVEAPVRSRGHLRKARFLLSPRRVAATTRALPRHTPSRPRERVWRATPRISTLRTPSRARASVALYLAKTGSHSHSFGAANEAPGQFAITPSDAPSTREGAPNLRGYLLRCNEGPYAAGAVLLVELVPSGGKPTRRATIAAHCLGSARSPTTAATLFEKNETSYAAAP